VLARGVAGARVSEDALPSADVAPPPAVVEAQAVRTTARNKAVAVDVER